MSVPGDLLFKYRLQLKAGQIRLVQPQKRSVNGQTLSLTMSTVDLPAGDGTSSRGVPYYALSYVWGDQVADVQITINGLPFYVRPNLALILESLENRIDKPIWIDALCINQGDTDEKNSQVDQMRFVYERADRTIIWLGSCNEQIERMIPKLKIIGKQANDAHILELNEGDIRGPSKWSSDPITVARVDGIRARLQAIMSENRENVTFSKADLDALVELTEKPWFKRVWIIQELCVSTEYEFACGNQTIEGDHFLAGFQICNLWVMGALDQLKNLSTRPGIVFQTATRFWNIVRFTGGRRIILNARAATTLGTRKKYRESFALKKHHQNSEEFLKSFTLKQNLLRAFIPINGGTLNATDARDRIFALLGVSSDTKELNVRVDYNKSVKQEDVYRDVAKRLLQRGHIDLLSFCRRNKSQQGTTLPSWAPDWSVPLPSAWGLTANDGLYNACGKMTFNMTEIHTDSTPDNEVELKAFRVGKISSTGTPGTLPNNEPASSIVRTLTIISIAEWLLARSGNRYTEQQRQEGVWRIPICDREYNALGQVVRATEKSWEEHTRLSKILRSKWALLTTSIDFVSYWGIMQDMDDVTTLLLDNNYVGIGHGGLKEGDEIWIPQGAHVPYAFRRTQDGKHMLLGEVFVYGIMDGEFMTNSAECMSMILV